MRLNKSTVLSSNLDKQKVALALAIFSSEVTSVLRLEFGEKAKATYLIFEFFNYYIFEPVLTTNTYKQCKNTKATPFYDVEDFGLNLFEEIAHWLQDGWYGSLKVRVPKT